MPAEIPLILHAVLEDYAFRWGGHHGVAHWARVFENGAKRPATIKWADGRASFGVVPEFVWEKWGIDLERNL
jgi:hypothetical protein